MHDMDEEVGPYRTQPMPAPRGAVKLERDRCLKILAETERIIRALGMDASLTRDNVAVGAADALMIAREHIESGQDFHYVGPAEVVADGDETSGSAE